MEQVPNHRFGLEFDPSHLVRQYIDPIQTAWDFRDRILAVHAKDTEIIQPVLAKVGIHGQDWWRYRIPGRDSSIGLSSLPSFCKWDFMGNGGGTRGSLLGCSARRRGPGDGSGTKGRVHSGSAFSAAVSTGTCVNFTGLAAYEVIILNGNSRRTANSDSRLEANPML